MNDNVKSCKPCFCGNTKISIKKRIHNAGMDGCYENWEFYCEGCGSTIAYAADGFYGRKYFKTIEDVIDEWNKDHENSSTQRITVYTDCRDKFIEAVKEVFTNDFEAFLDMMEYGKYSCRYDVFCDPDDECYIINRETGEYINWYKFSHLGRDIHSTCPPERFIDFLHEFKSTEYISIEEQGDKHSDKEFHCGFEESGGHAYNCNDCPNKCDEWYQWDKEMKNG